MRTNDLFRDLLDNKIQGHETPTLAWVEITPKFNAWTAQKPDPFNEWVESIYQQMNAAFESVRIAAEGMFRSCPFPGEWIDYGWQRGLTGIERTRFNGAVEELTRTTGWSREDSAKVLGRFMDSVERMDLSHMQNPAPADPRARALNHNQHRGTGPQPDTLRNRGRITRYKEKS